MHPISFRYVHSIEYMFRISNRHLQLLEGSAYQWTKRVEQMFNILNSVAKLRNSSPLVCKFLDNMTAFFQRVRSRRGSGCYLLEQMGFRKWEVAKVGLRFALMSCGE